MNLQVHLLYRIAATALICLLATASLLLVRSDRQATFTAGSTVETLGSQLELQLLKWGATLRLDNPFPDLVSWRPESLGIGDCVIFESQSGAATRRFCNGVEPPGTAAPAAFEALYRLIFTPGKTVSRPIVFHKHQYGTLMVARSASRELADAWAEISSLMAFTVLMLGAVCVLVYWSIHRALLPSRLIVAGLEEMRGGNLGGRLPGFELNEWRTIAEAVNDLAASQQQLLAERQGLAVKLMNLQEAERRDLARELHDEFGQCLAGVNALTLSIMQGAREQCPALVAEAEQIREISQRMLGGIRGLLSRLRPAELDELGLQASLDSLVSGWRNRHRGATQYHLRVDGDCAQLPEPVTLALFRAAQECLTNVAKHAAATQVALELTIRPDAARLTISDDGTATSVPHTFGVGLLGMRERIGALQGQLELQPALPHGLIVKIRLPLQGMNGAGS